ncbi:MAG: SRPBCC domain-containing protein [Phycisphaerae bacterium]
MNASKAQSPPVVRVTRVIRAPRERVFDAWVRPELRRQWWIAGGKPALTTCELDARPGGRYCMKQRGGCTDEAPDFEWEMEGQFVEVDRPRRLVFTWNVNHQPPVVDSRVTIDFNDVPGGTEIVLVHERLDTAALRDGTHDGWTHLIGHMAELLEGRASAPGSA